MKPFNIKQTRSLFLRRRKGAGLVLALVIILIGSALTAAMFEMGSAFMVSMGFQQNIYSDHTVGLNYIQEAIAFITRTNNAGGRIVLHRPPVSHDTRIITSVQDIQFPEEQLSFDQKVPGFLDLWARLSVFDVSYHGISAEMESHPEERKALPPPLNIYGTSSGGSGMKNDGDGALASDKSPYRYDEEMKANLENYGAYLVRVTLYRRDRQDRVSVVRKVEEGFFQVIK